MKWIHSLCIPAIILLSACGGGGGGGDAVVSGDSGSAVSIRMESDGLPVNSAAVQVLTVEGTALKKESYTGLLNGEEIILAKTVPGNLLLMLPGDLPPGSHELVVDIEGKKKTLHFESRASTGANRQTDLPSVQQTLLDSIADADDAVATLQTEGAPQERINEVIAHRDALSMVLAELDTLTDAEIFYLRQYFSFNLQTDTPLVGTSAAATPRNWDACVASFKRQHLALAGLMTAVVIGEVLVPAAKVAWANPLVAVAIGGVAGVAVIKVWPKLMSSIDDFIADCASINTTSLEQDLAVRSASAVAPRTTSIIDDERREYENDLAKRYRLVNEYRYEEQAASLLPDTRSAVIRLSDFLPDEKEAFFLARLVKDYSEEAPAASLNLEQISAPDVTGDLAPTGENTFELTFSKATGTPFENEFTFVIYDATNDIATRYTARLWSDGHCPDYTIDLANVVLTDDKCIVIQARPEIDSLDYQEYQQQALVMREYYTVGNAAGIELKSLKGLSDYDHIPEMWVERIDAYYQYSVLWEEPGRPSVRARNVLYSVGGSDLEYIYSAPILQLRGNSLEWDSVLKEAIYYLNDSPGPVSARELYSDPLQNDDYTWSSVMREQAWYDELGNIRSRHVFSEPMKGPDGTWASAEAEGYNYSESGEITLEVIYHVPAFSNDGVLQAPKSIYRDWDGDSLVEETIFTLPLQTTAGDWQSVPEERLYSVDGWTELSYYSAPLLATDGTWESLVVRKETTYDTGGTTVLIQSEPLQATSGEWQSVMLSTSSSEPSGYSNDAVFSEPLQQSDGNWVSVMESSSRTWEDGTSQSITYTNPLQNDDGSWTSVLDEERNYSGATMTSIATYAAPQKPSNGIWGTSYLSRTIWSGNSRTELDYSSLLEAPDGSFVTSVIKTKRAYDGSTLQTEWLYASPYLDEYDTWTTYIRRVNYHSSGCYTTYSQNGSILTDTCQ
ncbi:MAG: hypothetical protein MI745_06190 [Pseudomonadales bacterium]|nr:hypothetical protein [Pseudomonadales bacterium]